MTISLNSNKTQLLYEQDFYLWLQTTAQLLKERRFNEMDLENLLEEIEAMGRSEKKGIKSRLITLIEHLLKLMYWESEKDYNARGWRITIVEQRNQIELALEDSPSLRALLIEVFPDCYQKARKMTLQKYNLSSTLFPVKPPFTLEELLSSDYLPD